jgi:hypothetical protein
VVGPDRPALALDPADDGVELTSYFQGPLRTAKGGGDGLKFSRLMAVAEVRSSSHRRISRVSLSDRT